MRVDSLSNALIGIVDSERWVASFAEGEVRRYGASGEGVPPARADYRSNFAYRSS
jgi:hypothetical protein